MGRGGCTAVSTVTTGHSSTLLCREARDRLFRDGQGDVTWVDALVDIAERSVDAAPVERRERYRVNLFLDPACRRR